MKTYEENILGSCVLAPGVSDLTQIIGKGKSILLAYSDHCGYSF